jgi:hypothetical protein
MRRWSAVICVALVAACGGERTRRGPGDPGDSGGSRVDSGVHADGALSGDGGGDVDGGLATGTDGGGSICGPGGTWECGPRDCHDRPECLARDLELLGYDAYTECGAPRSFTEAD